MIVRVIKIVNYMIIMGSFSTDNCCQLHLANLVCLVVAINLEIIASVVTLVFFSLKVQMKDLETEVNTLQKEKEDLNHALQSAKTTSNCNK